MVIDEGEFGGAWTYSISTVDEEAADETVYEIEITHTGKQGKVLDTMFLSGFRAVADAKGTLDLLSHELPRDGDVQRLLKTMNASPEKVYGDDTMLLLTRLVGVSAR